MVVMAAASMAGSDTANAAGGAGAAQANANPRVIPNQGRLYGDLAALWWLWAYSFSAADVPFLQGSGAVDLSAGQEGHIWFLAGSNVGPVIRSAVVPTGVQLFLPMANLVNDYPCPDPNFKPDPGESLEHFLTRTALPYLDLMTGLFATVDGVALRNLTVYEATSSIFTFTADPALAATVDPCITGTAQPGVATGFWLLLTPLPPGDHVVHFGSTGWGQDVTYQLKVEPGKGH
jgi:hypothetical protein